MKEETMELAPDECEVVEILANFEAIYMKSNSRFRFPFTWGRKKRRSAIRFKISPSMLYHRPENSSAAGSQSPPPPKAEASSPATPLSFSPSESEDKPPLFRRNVSLKRKREHYLKIIEDLNKDNNLIQGEIKNVKCYFDRLKNFNLKLKARKQELAHNRAEFASVQEEQLQQFRSSLLMATNQTVSLPEFSANRSVTLFPIQPTTSLGVASTNDVMGPIGIPDLNLPVVDTCEGEEEATLGGVNFDDKKSNRDLAAQARQKRIQICRFKNPIANNRMRYSCR